jgi:ribonucleoside-diphosphate reductase alpha chain
MPAEATIEEVKQVYADAWKMMLKAIALYRDGSKLSQPLNSTSEEDELAILGGDEEETNPVATPKMVQDMAAIRAIKQKLPNKRIGHLLRS